MSTPVMTEQYLANLLAGRWEQVTRKLTDLAEAIPAENFETAPVAGLRTCGAVLRHVAFWNRYVADSLAGKAPNDSGNELDLSAYPHKQSILAELMRTSEEIVSTLGNHPDGLGQQHSELMLTFIEHTSEHCGQLAVYARIIGIVPPASRS